MNTTNKFSKIIATTICNISTKIANTSTYACVGTILEEPKLPKVLLEKTKAK